MRKRMIHQAVENTPSFNLNFLDLERLAQVEFTSEHPDHPVESAMQLVGYTGAGWLAAEVGEQTIRVVFDQPCTVEHIILMFEEQNQSRTQEFALLWLRDGEDSYRDILRQQYHFSPPDTVLETEHYKVRLDQLKALELRINPDINGGKNCAKLKQLRLA